MLPFHTCQDCLVGTPVVESENSHVIQMLKEGIQATSQTYKSTSVSLSKNADVHIIPEDIHSQ
jgi:hypothetical protein